MLRRIRAFSRFLKQLRLCLSFAKVMEEVHPTSAGSTSVVSGHFRQIERHQRLFVAGILWILWIQQLSFNMKLLYPDTSWTICAQDQFINSGAATSTTRSAWRSGLSSVPPALFASKSLAKWILARSETDICGGWWLHFIVTVQYVHGCRKTA